MAEQISMNMDELTDKYIPLLNTVAELVNTHPSIPEEVEQADLMSGLLTIAAELKSSVSGKVPEIVKLQEEIERKNRQVLKLQETNQQLYLRVGTAPDPSKQKEDDAPKKLSFEEIKQIIDKL